MYRILKDPFTDKDSVIVRLLDNASIPFDPDNTDYQAFLKFLEDGGTPLPADEVA